MIETVMSKLGTEAPVEVVFIVMGLLLSYLIRKIRKGITDYWSRKRLKNELAKLRVKKRKIRVIDLANGDPDFANQDILVRTIQILGKTKSLFIDLGEEEKQILHEKQREMGYSTEQISSFHNDCSFNGNGDFSELAEMTGIDDLPELIKEHRVIVGKKFIDSNEGLLFNAKKYGIYNLSFTRFGEEEKPGAELDLFETDYFTHRVFRSIYQELKERKHEICDVTAHNFLQYKPFLTSFGINTLLITQGEKGKEIILSLRSKKVHGKKEMFHVTMNEGLSTTDKDPFGKIDLELCFKRGLLEELGIDEKLYRLGVHAAFYDFFLELNNFEIGLSSILEMDLNFEKDILPLVGRDKTMESSSFKGVQLKKSVIEKVLKEYEFIPHGQYVIERVLLRKNITVDI